MRLPYWELRLIGGAAAGRNPVVLGRKFCVGCGHWRHASDYAYKLKRGRPRLEARCYACLSRQRRANYLTWTDDQRERQREYYRFWSDAKRRERGAPKYALRAWTAVGAVERVLLERAPLLVEVEHCDVDDRTLSRRSGVPERTIRRLRSGESQHVRLDVADKLAVALGVPLALIYREDGAELLRDEAA